jgi:hypothetical protein
MKPSMKKAITITNDELAILSDIVAMWSVKRAEKFDAGKRLALDHLIANGFVEQVDSYKHTAKADLLFTQRGSGVSGG